MSRGRDTPAGANSVTTPDVEIVAILPTPYSVNHSAPSGPMMIDCGWLLAVGMGYSVNTPAVVIRPIKFRSVNQMAPSGPVNTPRGVVPAILLSVTAPAVVIRAMKPAASVNHSAPSGPEVIPNGEVSEIGMGNSVIDPTDTPVVMVVISVVLALADPPPETVTWFTCGDVAFTATFTVTVIDE